MKPLGLAVGAAQLSMLAALAAAVAALAMRLGTATSACPAPDFVLVSQRLVAGGRVRPGAVVVRGGVIGAVTSVEEGRALGLPVEDAAAAAVLPGAVDIHVHLNEPDAPPRAGWEGLRSGTMAAAAGGVTTVVDMPLNSVPTTLDAASFRAKLSAARAPGKLHTDVGFWGGLVPGNALDEGALRGMLEAGALGLKAFQSPSGIPDFGNANETHLRAGVRALGGRPLLVHAELPPLDAPPPAGEPRKFATWGDSRPAKWEADAVEVLVRVAREEGGPVHVVHVSDGGATLELLRGAARDGLPVTAETCTHYLAFAAEDVEDGDVRFKCAPPIRSRANREALWAELLRSGGVLTAVTSDHSPAPASVKHLDTGDFTKAWGGISGLQYGLTATWAHGAPRGVTLPQLASWLASGPAAVAQLGRKGEVEAGRDADLVVFDPDEEWVLSAGDTNYHRHKLTAYEGSPMRGRVLRTYVRGREVFRRGRGGEEDTFAACGRPVLRG